MGRKIEGKSLANIYLISMIIVKIIHTYANEIFHMQSK